MELLPDRPIAFNRDFVDLGIGITGALFLSQAVYWAKRTQNQTGWFYKTTQEWEEETGMKRRQIENARKKLRDLGILHEKKKGIPAKTYYYIDQKRTVELLKQAWTERANKVAPNVPSYSTERTNQVAPNVPSTTETTTETSSYTTTETTTDIPRENEFSQGHEEVDLGDVFDDKEEPEPEKEPEVKTYDPDSRSAYEKISYGEEVTEEEKNKMIEEFRRRREELKKGKTVSGSYEKPYRDFLQEEKDNTPPEEMESVSETEFEAGDVSEEVVEREEKETENIGQQIAEVIHLFRYLSPSIKYQNKTERKACQEMIEYYGYRQTYAIAQYAISEQGQPYCPTIAKPSQLWRDIGRLRAYKKRKEEEKEAKKPSVVKI